MYLSKNWTAFKKDPPWDKRVTPIQGCPTFSSLKLNPTDNGRISVIDGGSHYTVGFNFRRYIGVQFLDRETAGMVVGGFNTKRYLQLMKWQAQLAQEHLAQTGQITVIIQDGASFHKSRVVQQQWQRWQSSWFVCIFSTTLFSTNESNRSGMVTSQTRPISVFVYLIMNMTLLWL